MTNQTKILLFKTQYFEVKTFVNVYSILNKESRCCLHHLDLILHEHRLSTKFVIL